MALSPDDPAAAAAEFAAGFEPLAELVAPGGPGAAAAFANLLSPRDSQLMQDPRLASALAGTMRGDCAREPAAVAGTTSPGSGHGMST
jgi:hypothetical protein